MITEAERKVILKAEKILRRELLKEKPALTSPDEVRRYLRISLQHLESEEFHCLYMDTQHRVVATEKLFSGTIDASSVYPREVLKRCMFHNAAAVIFAHNHPSGIAEPSQADQRITIRLRDALALVDVRVLDHIVVGADMVSMAERGLL
jgi:DNA repair protein RadC